MDKSYKNKEWLEGKYVREKLTKLQIAKLCGVVFQTIFRWTKIYNIPSRPFSETNKGRICSEETRQKMSNSLKGRITWNKGLTKETDKRLEQVSEKYRGKNNGNWKGGIRKNEKGYIEVWINKTDPFFIMRRKNTYNILQHRLVMAQHLDRCLKTWEFVHHINNIKNDNRLDNLIILTKSQHIKLQIFLANLWIKENQNKVEKITRDFLKI